MAGEGAADGDVAEAAEVTEADSAAAVDAVVTDSEIGDWNRVSGAGLETGVECGQGRPAVEGAVRSMLVVVAAEAVELELQECSGDGGWLFGQEPLEGLVEALDLAAGLGVVGRGVLAESVVYSDSPHCDIEHLTNHLRAT